METDFKKMKGKHLIRVLCLISVPLLISGIIRHDIDKSQYVELANQEQFKGVGQIYLKSESMGSGVLIKDNYVLTAAHNIIDSDTKIDTINNNGTIFYANTSINHRVANRDSVFFELEDEKYLIDSIIIHPKYLENIDDGNHDMAILKLRKSLTNVSPTKLNLSNNEKMSEVVGVGFGFFGTGNKKELTLSKEKIAGQNTIDSIGGIELRGVSTYLFCDFDHPEDASLNRMGSAKPTDLEYLCTAGDSGGGLFRMLNKNEWELVGICKGTEFNQKQFDISAHYGQIMRWTRIYPYRKWILESISN